MAAALVAGQPGELALDTRRALPGDRFAIGPDMRRDGRVKGWTGGAGGWGMRSGPDGDGDGQFEAEPPPESVRHVVNAANQVERVVLGPTVTNIDLLHDQAGNIVFDGVYYLQYDAFNRLVQVNGAGTLTVYDFEVDPLGPRPGRIKAACVSKLGGLVARYVYDGLGRLTLDAMANALRSRPAAGSPMASLSCQGLIRKETPADSFDPLSRIRTEDYYPALDTTGTLRVRTFGPRAEARPSSQGYTACGGCRKTSPRWTRRAPRSSTHRTSPSAGPSGSTSTLDTLRAPPGDRFAIGPDMRRDGRVKGLRPGVRG